MANNQNLIPASDPRGHRVSREDASRGGKRSGEVRRARKTMAEIARQIASAEVSSPEAKKKLQKLGIEDESQVNSALVTASIFNQAVKGNMQAVERWEKLTDVGNDDDKPYELPGRVLGKAFVDINREIFPNIDYVFKGGRGGLKSTYISEKIIELIKNHPTMHACVVRKVGNTLKDSVYAQVKWALNELGVEGEFDCKVSPLEITYKKTGQKIYFRGADDDQKLKSIKPEFGYIGILWLEEKDQFKGEAEERSIKQSVLRGGDVTYYFSSYNPPKSKSSWVNKAEQKPNDKRVIHESNYLDAPKSWLGQKFIDDAEHLKEVNPEAYEHEYMGVANGDGGNVFEYIEIREITDEEISHMDTIHQGIDFGWYPDKFGFIRTYYDEDAEKIYFIDEDYANKQTNEQSAKKIAEKGYDDFPIICDSAEPKSINDLRDNGLPARGALKGAGSREYGFKWLQIRTLVFDPRRTPNALKEFSEYQYDRDKEGNVVSGYPEGQDDHLISATRYSYEPLFNRRGYSA